MNGKHQVTHTCAIAAPRSTVWAVIADDRLLPQWAPVVDALVDVDGPGGVGTTRTCSVDFQGRSGTMTERCVDFDPERRASYVIVDDSLGFSRLLRDYGFTMTLDDHPDGCSLRIDTYYTPRNVPAQLMNRVLLRRQMRKTVRSIAEGLKTFSERTAHAAPPQAPHAGPAPTADDRMRRRHLDDRAAAERRAQSPRP